MDIWMRKCKRTSICKYCGLPITHGDYEIVGRAWAKPKSDQSMQSGMRFHKDFHWHQINPDGVHCWEQQAINSIDKIPDIPSRAGRKKLEITDEQRRARYKLVNLRSTYTAKIREELTKPPDVQDFDLIVFLGAKISQIKEDVAELGGVPASW